MNIYVYINILVLIRTLYYILVITLYSGCRLLDRTDSLFFIILSKSYLLYNYIIINNIVLVILIVLVIPYHVIVPVIVIVIIIR